MSNEDTRPFTQRVGAPCALCGKLKPLDDLRFDDHYHDLICKDESDCRRITVNGFRISEWHYRDAVRTGEETIVYRDNRVTITYSPKTSSFVQMNNLDKDYVVPILFKREVPAQPKT